MSGCHSLTRAGKRDARSLTPGRALCPAQYGHPCPKALRENGASHSCPSQHRHTAFADDMGRTSDGDFAPRTHCFAMSGNLEPKSVTPFTVTVPSQTEHSVDDDALSQTLISVICPSGQTHFARNDDPTVTSSEFFLLDGCHMAASSGRLDARSLKPFKTRMPAQNGHPLPRVRERTGASHSCPHCPRHRAGYDDPAETVSALRLSTHSFTRCGCVDARSLNPLRTRCPEQKGHPPLFLVLETTAASHSCPQSPVHQTFLLE